MEASLSASVPHGKDAQGPEGTALPTQIRKEKIPAVFLENISDPRLMRQIASRPEQRSVERFIRIA